MSFDATTLEPHIRAILGAPGVDFSTISAKRVRKQLLDEDPDLSPDVVKAHKDDIDKVIGTVYEDLVNSREGDEDDGDDGKRRREEDDEEEDEEKPATKSKPAKKVKRAPKEELTDAEIAKQLDSELNGRSRSSRSGGPTKTKGKANGTGKRSKKVKSAETVASDGEGEDGETKPKKRGGGLTKEYNLSEPLATLLNVERMSRPQVVKHVWDYIKAKDLQNPTDRREILCDETLKGIFHCEKMSMFKMNQLLGAHLIPIEL
ncbi:SWIB-domain-containing protein [Panus rudis PR-1116 ss-1]|nr:SWIB-domain-containing protein [Panus rudis PR-1116 ss-1]